MKCATSFALRLGERRMNGWPQKSAEGAKEDIQGRYFYKESRKKGRKEGKTLTNSGLFLVSFSPASLKSPTWPLAAPSPILFCAFCAFSRPSHSAFAKADG